MFVDELGVPVPPEQDAEIIEPSYDTLQFHAVDEEDCQRRFLLAYVVEKSVLKALRFFRRHTFLSAS